MRIVFMGTPAYAVPALEALSACAGHELIAVFSRADAPSGRGKTLYPSEVRKVALERGIPTFTPDSLRNRDMQARLVAMAPDVIVVAAYGMILPAEVLDIPPLGCINLHASLLPRWRGAAPIQRAVLAGDDRVGVCLMKMEEGLDTGPYAPCGAIEVGMRNASELESELAHLGAEGLMKALPRIADGSFVWHAQDESLVTYAEKIRKEELLLMPSITCMQAMRRIQASSHRAPARCIVCGKEVQVLAARPAEEPAKPGEVVLGKHSVSLGFADGTLELVEVKPQGKKAMLASQWANGLRGAEPTWQGIGE